MFKTEDLRPLWGILGKHFKLIDGYWKNEIVTRKLCELFDQENRMLESKSIITPMRIKHKNFNGRLKNFEKRTDKLNNGIETI